MRLKIKFEKYPLDTISYKVELIENYDMGEYPLEVSKKFATKEDADKYIIKLITTICNDFGTTVNITETANDITYDCIKDDC